jgi:hypothetical protein
MRTAEMVVNVYETTRRLNTDYAHHSGDLKLNNAFANFICEIN